MRSWLYPQMRVSYGAVLILGISLELVRTLLPLNSILIMLYTTMHIVI